MNKIEDDIQKIISAYDYLVKGIDGKASISTDRAYGGILRANKGTLVEDIARELVHISWDNMGLNPNRLSTGRVPIKINIEDRYVDRIKNELVREHIKRNIHRYSYLYKPDVLVTIDKNPEITIECKAYTENAMLKRILVDFTLVKSIYPNMKFILFQLESQLGGDYSELRDTPFGSPSTHTLLSHFDIDLEIITLIKGERKVDKPIHKAEYYKPLTVEALANSIKQIQNIMKGMVG